MSRAGGQYSEIIGMLNEIRSKVGLGPLHGDSRANTNVRQDNYDNFEDWLWDFKIVCEDYNSKLVVSSDHVAGRFAPRFDPEKFG